MINVGTTFALEGCLSQVPIIQLVIPNKYLSFYEQSKNPHLKSLLYESDHIIKIQNSLFELLPHIQDSCINYSKELKRKLEKL